MALFGWLALSVGTAGEVAAQTLPPPSIAPNVIVITVDGLGYGDLGYRGGADVATSNIDRLASEGVVFTDGYAAQPLSSAARAALLTGRHPARFGLEENLALEWRDREQALPREEKVLSEYLRDSGYRTGLIGKWHLGANEDFVPQKRGFDTFFGFVGAGHDYWRTDANALADQYLVPLNENRNNQSLDGEYLTDLLTDKAIEFVEGEDDDPFFLQLAYNAPQAPFQAPEDLLARYGGEPDKSRRTYLAMVESLDSNVGRLLDALESSSLRSRTLIFFLADHGASSPADNGLLRGGAGSLSEGGVRVPFLASWPARWPEGQTFRQPVSTLDVAATVLAMAGVTRPSSAPALDGVDLDPFVRGDRTEAPHEALYWRRSTTGGYAIRSGDLKLVREDSDSEAALYDLAADPGETRSVLVGNAAAAATLASLWNAWNEENTDGNLFTPAETYETKRRKYFEDDAARRASSAEGRVVPPFGPFLDEGSETSDGTAQTPRSPPDVTPLIPLPPPATAPNVIVILVDDLGYADLSLTGSSDIQTPSIDRLAAEGIFFPNGYVTGPICSPSRFALLSGRHQSRFRHEGNIANDPFNTLYGLPTTEKTIARRLQGAGFRTGAVGKWHVGAAEPFLPKNRGFDYFFGMLGGGHQYFWSDAAQMGTEFDAPLIEGDDSYNLAGEYLTDVLTDKAIEFLNGGTDTPFFLYLAYNAPHAPLHAPAELVAKYSHIPNKSRRTYLAQVDSIDRNVGRLLDALEVAGLRDDTLVFFLSDHGGPRSVGASNAPFTGYKGSFREGGIRVPFIASWPARWPQGVTFEPLVWSLDIAATAAAMAQVSPNDAPPLDGVDLDAFVRGESSDVPHQGLFWRHSFNSPIGVVRSGDMKLVQSGGNSFLYDLANDPGETIDILRGNAAVANRLGALWNAWNEGNQPGTVTRGIGYYSNQRKQRLARVAADTVRAAAGQRFIIDAIQALPSSGTRLKSLTLTGVDIGTFAAMRTEYEASVEHTVTATTVTATASDAGASVVIADGDGSTSGTSRTVSLAEGANKITVTVTGGDGRTSVAYAVTVTRKLAPLTATIENLPATHDGSTAFTFNTRFSATLQNSYRTLRDRAFAVMGGNVTSATRVNGSSKYWAIKVQPGGFGDVTIVLAANRSCSSGPCAEGGRRLSNRLEATVRGPGSEASDAGFGLAAANSNPSGIWSDGETAWVADLQDARLYAYRREDGERLPDRDVETSPGPMGLWSDGETLWVAGLGGGLRALRLSDGSRLAGRDLAVEASTVPAGVWSDGETAWVSEWLGDTVHAYHLSDGRRVASRDIKLAHGNLLPVGLWSDGETLWVADWRERVYAYRLSDGRRDPGRDIFTGAGDTDPSGLWADAGTLLSTSWESGEVRAYRLPELPSRTARPGKGNEVRPPDRAASLPPIADAALRAAIGEALGKEPGEAASPEELAGLEALKARNGGIRDLTGLERAVGLKELDLGFNPIADLRPLAALPRLASLSLDGAAPDLHVLSSLTGLRRLSVRHNGIGDLGALAPLAGLAELDVGDNRIEDLSPLAGLTQLTVLRADRNRIADLWPLALLGRLEGLDLGSNRVRDLQPLAGMAQLKTLGLGHNSLVELHPLAGLEGLTALDIAGNAVEDMRVLSGLDGLRRLDLRGNAVGDLRPVRALPSLAWVHVGGTGIEDLSPLDGLAGLTVAGRDDLEPPSIGTSDGRAGQY